MRHRVQDPHCSCASAATQALHGRQAPDLLGARDLRQCLLCKHAQAAKQMVAGYAASLACDRPVQCAQCSFVDAAMHAQAGKVTCWMSR